MVIDFIYIYLESFLIKDKIINSDGGTTKDNTRKLYNYIVFC